MKPTKLSYSVLLLALLTSLVSDIVAAPMGTAFTYQGRLVSGTNAANGLYDFTFALFDDPGTWSQKGPTLADNGVPATNGLFTVTLDFGNVFDGNGRWLAVWVRTNGAASYTQLTPRQPLTPTPYAVFASSLSSNVNQTFTGTVDFSPISGPPFTVGNSAKVVNLNADLLDGLDSTAFWQLGGNAGTTAGVHFLGTTDNQPLELRVNSQRAMRIVQTQTDAVPNIICGSSNNFVGLMEGDDRGVGDTISGGAGNSIYGDYSTIGGGFQNSTIKNAPGHRGTTIGGGVGNQCNDPYATIGGGEGNSVGAGDPTTHSTIGGGHSNHIGSGYGTIAGGDGNAIGRGSCDTISGGQNNAIHNAGNSLGYNAIGGGQGNRIVPDYPGIVDRGVIAGGQDNVVNGYFGTIPGGQENAATNYAFAAGRRAKANHDGAFVWADSTNADFVSTAKNEVAFRCQGGVRFTSATGGGNQTVSWTPGSASWSFSSDRNLKEGIATVDGKAVLERLSRLSVAEWNYKGYAQRHIGPMAQDFHALFPLNESETTLNSADLDGVALAAIKGLNEVVKEKDAEIKALQQSLTELKSVVNTLLEKSNGGGR